MDKKILEFLKQDRVVALLTEKFDVKPLPVTKDIYFDMLENIVSQQLSGRVASTIFNRFLDLFPNRYPKPNILLKLDDSQLQGIGLSVAKTSYVKAMANFAINNDLNIAKIQLLSDEEVIKLLTQIKGVGVWTVQMLLIFSLGREDVFPIDDLAVRQGMIELYGIGSDNKLAKFKISEIASHWSPYRTWGTRLIWAYMNEKKKNATRM